MQKDSVHIDAVHSLQAQEQRDAHRRQSLGRAEPTGRWAHDTAPGQSSAGSSSVRSPEILQPNIFCDICTRKICHLLQDHSLFLLQSLLHPPPTPSVNPGGSGHWGGCVSQGSQSGLRSHQLAPFQMQAIDIQEHEHK